MPFRIITDFFQVHWNPICCLCWGPGAGAGGGCLWAPLDLDKGPTKHSAASNQTIKVTQVNLNKSNTAQLELTIQLKKTDIFLCLVTEPAVLRKKLSCIPSHYTVLPSERGNSPRAAIFSSKTVPIYEVTSLRHRDMVVGVVMCGSKKQLL